MATQGQQTVGCITSLSAAARLAAASTCHVAGLHPPGPHRPPVRGGGAAASFGPAMRPPSPDRLSTATRAQCVAAGHHALPGAAPDPALTALGVLLSSAAPPPALPSLGQRLAGQLANLATLLQAATTRIAALLPVPGDPATVTDAIVDARPTDAAQPAPPPRVPTQPPGPTLTIDPALGIIVEVEPEGGAAPAGPGVEDAEAGPPTSWLPVTGPLLAAADRTRRAIGVLFARVDDLLESARTSRLQLLLLLLVAPPAVVFLIDVIASMLGE